MLFFRHNITLGSFLQFMGVALLVVGVLWYVHFQARNILNGPSIALHDEPAAVQDERVVLISGTARNIVKLTLNGKEIYTNETGDFDYPLVLEEGYTITTLRAEDRFGRTTTLSRQYVYTGG